MASPSLHNSTGPVDWPKVVRKKNNSKIGGNDSGSRGIKVLGKVMSQIQTKFSGILFIVSTQQGVPKANVFTKELRIIIKATRRSNAATTIIALPDQFKCGPYALLTVNLA